MSNMNRNKLLDNNAVLMALSVFGAILIWVMVVYNIDTMIPVTISNVPVNINTADSNLTRLDLYPVTDGEFTVDVEIVGPRATVGNIKREELQATAKLNNITGPGTYDLPIEIVDTRNRDIEIKTSLPETISMRFDHKETLTLTIGIEATGLEIAEGYLLDQERVYPEQVTVTGPATEMQQVAEAVVVRQFDDRALSDTFSEELPILLRSSSGETVTSPYFALDTETATLTLPVLKKKVVPVTFDFINIPEGFDVASLVYRITPEEIEVAGPVSKLDSFREMHLGYVDVRTLAPDVNLFYRIKFPSDFISVEGIEDANIEFFPETFGEATLAVESDNIYIRNLPEQYEATIQTQAINNVTVYGPADEVTELSNQNLVAEINLANTDITLGQVTVPVTILVPGHSRCWAYGDHYTARITVREKDG